MSVSDSRFNMWRGVVAFAHANQDVEPKEREFIVKFFETVPFSHEQQLQLLEELETPQDLDDIFEKITEANDRSEFILFARMMCWADGSLDAQEEAILKRMNGEIIRKIDLDNMMRQTDAAAREAQKRLEDEEAEGGGLGGIFGALKDILS